MSTPKIHLDAAGQASRVRCGKWHPETRTLERTPHGHYRCAGCGTLYPPDAVADVQDHPPYGTRGLGKRWTLTEIPSRKFSKNRE